MIHAVKLLLELQQQPILSMCCKELGKFAIRTARVLTAVEFYYLTFYRDEGKLSFMEAVCAYPTAGFGIIDIGKFILKIGSRFIISPVVRDFISNPKLENIVAVHLREEQGVIGELSKDAELLDIDVEHILNPNIQIVPVNVP